ncbi:MAG: hypothetical protein WCK98_01920 [bacterium]
MIFVDTNYINRFLLQDLPDQCILVNELFEKSLKKEIVLFATDLVFFEVCWSLQQFYGLEEADVLNKMYEIMASGALNFQSNEILQKAILASKNNSLGIEDNFNLLFALQSRAKNFATFDKKLLKLWKES